MSVEHISQEYMGKQVKIKDLPDCPVCVVTGITLQAEMTVRYVDKAGVVRAHGGLHWFNLEIVE